MREPRRGTKFRVNRSNSIYHVVSCRDGAMPPGQVPKTESRRWRRDGGSMSAEDSVRMYGGDHRKKTSQLRDVREAGRRIKQTRIGSSVKLRTWSTPDKRSSVQRLLPTLLSMPSSSLRGQPIEGRLHPEAWNHALQLHSPELFNGATGQHTTPTHASARNTSPLQRAPKSKMEELIHRG